MRLVGGSPAVGRLKQGDILLAIDDKVVTRFREVELAVADKPEVSVTVWRDGEEQQVPLPTAALSGNDIDRIVMWAGATLAGATPRDDRAAGHPARRRVRGLFRLWIAGHALWTVPGPAHRRSGRHSHPDLDAFLKVVSGRPDRSAIRLRTITWNNAPEVITLKLDRHYWPTYELRAGTEWQDGSGRDLE